MIRYKCSCHNCLLIMIKNSTIVISIYHTTRVRDYNGVKVYTKTIIDDKKCEYVTFVTLLNYLLTFTIECIRKTLCEIYGFPLYYRTKYSGPDESL